MTSRTILLDRAERALDVRREARREADLACIEYYRSSAEYERAAAAADRANVAAERALDRANQIPEAERRPALDEAGVLLDEFTRAIDESKRARIEREVASTLALRLHDRAEAAFHALQAAVAALDAEEEGNGNGASVSPGTEATL